MQTDRNRPRSPKVTLLMITFNQRDFVRVALEAALSQNFGDYEILVSDDCSTDGTFSVIQQVVDEFNDERDIVAVQQPENLGIGGNINAAMRLARGTIIVVAAGDDISKPDRVSKIVEAFESPSRDVRLVFSGFDEVDDRGIFVRRCVDQPDSGAFELATLCTRLFEGVSGATAAWHRDVFDVFGPLKPNTVYEDRSIVFRAALLGRIVFVPDTLVQYRIHERNTVALYRKTDRAKQVQILDHLIHAYRSNRADLALIHDLRRRPSRLAFGLLRLIVLRKQWQLQLHREIASGSHVTSLAASFGLAGLFGNPLNSLRLFSPWRLKR